MFLQEFSSSEKTKNENISPIKLKIKQFISQTKQKENKIVERQIYSTINKFIIQFYYRKWHKTYKIIYRKVGKKNI